MAENIVQTTEQNVGAGSGDEGRSLLGDAWRELRGNWVFWVASGLILIVVLMAAFPGLFTRVDPTYCDLSRARQGPSAEAWFGYNLQGCDVFARTIHGARSSVLVAL